MRVLACTVVGVAAGISAGWLLRNVDFPAGILVAFCVSALVTFLALIATSG